MSLDMSIALPIPAISYTHNTRQMLAASWGEPETALWTVIANNTYIAIAI